MSKSAAFIPLTPRRTADSEGKPNSQLTSTPIHNPSYSEHLSTLKRLYEELGIILRNQESLIDYVKRTQKLESQTAELAVLSRKDYVNSIRSSMETAKQVADRLHYSSPNQVRARLAQRKLIGVIPMGRERGALYPIWQFDKDMHVYLEELILDFPESEPMWSIYEFFEEPNVNLHGLRPREVFTGVAEINVELTSKAKALLREKPSVRNAHLKPAIQEFANAP